MIKFNKYNVTDTATGAKARVHYSHGKIINDARDCVTIYAKDYGSDLGKIFAAIYQNDTNTLEDYFEAGRVRIFSDDPLFKTALARAKG